MTEAGSSDGDPFAGPSETHALGRAMDWATTPLGPVERWSPTLRTTVRAALAAPFPINLWCGPGLTLVYNDAYRAVLGAKHPAAFGRPGTEVWAEIWDEIAPMFERMRCGGSAVYANDAAFWVERRGGAARRIRGVEPNAWFTYSLSPVRDETGAIVAFLNIVSESTMRVLAEQATEAARQKAERAEARLRDIFSQAPAFLAVLRGPDFVFEYVNDAYYQLVGNRELIGQPVFEALPEVRGQGFEALLRGVLETGEAFVGREMPIHVSRGRGAPPQRRYLDFVYYPFSEADGARSGVVVHGSDVTDHVLARQEAQRARAQAEEANQAKSAFLASMSHELRTPINAIVGYTELTEMGLAGPLTAAQRVNLKRIRASSRHLLALVNEVLDLARVEAGEMRLEPHRVPVSDTVQEALDLIGPEAARRRVEVRAEPEASPRLAYHADPNRTRQVLLNLLSNAVKFTDAGGSVAVRIGDTDRPDPDADVRGAGPWVRIDVEDTGNGIPADRLQQIFDPFFQVDTGYTRERGGTGLGLTISRRLARTMGGDLTVRSTVGEGSRFSLWLPAGDSAAEATDSHAWLRISHDVPRLAEVGRALVRNADPIVADYVQSLGADASVPGAHGHDDRELGDHTATFLVDIGLSLVALSEERIEPALMQDGTEIQRLISERHGAQRARLGWNEEALGREFEILREAVERSLRETVPQDGGAGLGEAFGVLGRLLEQAEWVSRQGYRYALGSGS